MTRGFRTLVSLLLLSLSSNSGRTADFGSVNLGSSPGRDAKGGCANTPPASTVDAPRGGREAHYLWVISMSLRAI